MDDNGPGPRRWSVGWGEGYIAVSTMGSTTAVTTASNFIRHGVIGRGARVLDLGAGHGRVTELVIRAVPDLSVVAVDLTQQLLENFAVSAGVNGCRLDRVRANIDATRLPFRDDHFDAAVSSRVFHYLGDPPATLGEAMRVVKPGGRVVVSVPNRNNPIKRLTYRRARLYSPLDVAEWFHHCGFEAVRVASMCFFPSTRRWRRMAAACEAAARVPGARLLGGNVLVSGRKP